MFAKGWACTADLHTFCKRPGMHTAQLTHIRYAKGWANSQTFCKRVGYAQLIHKHFVKGQAYTFHN